MATFQVVDEFVLNLAGGGGTGFLDLPADSFRAALTNTAPTKAGTNLLSGITQISGAGGYTTVALTGVTFTETGAGTGIWEFDSNPFSWTASGASFDAFRYVVIYDDTPASPADPVIGYADYGATVNLVSGATFTVTPGANGILRITVS